MPFKDTKILEFNQCQKSDKAPFVIYADLECIIKRLMDVKIIPKSKRTCSIKFFNVNKRARNENN